VKLLAILAPASIRFLIQVKAEAVWGGTPPEGVPCTASEFSDIGIGLRARPGPGVRNQLRPRADTAQTQLEGSWRLVQQQHLLREKS
jgi:hypothetical protein